MSCFVGRQAFWSFATLIPSLSKAQFPPPPIRPMRQLEDYRYLAEAGNRQGAWWERLKCIPIGESPYAPFLTFGGEVRLRYELIDNTDFGSGPQDNGGYLLTRFMPYAALTLPNLPAGWELQLFVQFEAASSNYDERGPGTPLARDSSEVGRSALECSTGTTKACYSSAVSTASVVMVASSPGAWERKLAT